MKRMQSYTSKRMAALLSIVLLGIMLNFNNCSQEGQYGLFQPSSLCDGTAEECFSSAGAESMDLRIHGSTQLSVPLVLAQQSDRPADSTPRVITLSGDCNEGGFKDHAIIWRLYNAGSNGNVLISTSTFQDQLSRKALYTTKCKNGRFELKVGLISVGTTPATNRILCGALQDTTAATFPTFPTCPTPSTSILRANHTLEIQIIGYTEGGEAVTDDNIARKRITLVPGS